MSAGSPVPVVVLMGGPSAEHDVSLVSGRAIAGALAGVGHPVEGWAIDLAGRWWSLPASALDRSIPPAAYDDPAALGASGPFSAAGALDLLAARHPAPVVFPALHGPFGEDGQVQALLESAGLVTCGSGTAASAIGMDKSLFKRACGSIELPVLPWVEVREGEWRADLVDALADLRTFSASLPDPRLIVKPARLGSSIGVSIVHDPQADPELIAAVEEALRYDDLAIVEPYLDHPRELEVSIVGNHRGDVAVYGPGEILPGREFYDFVAKYTDGVSQTLDRAELDPVLREEIRRIAREVFLAIGCSGFARVDFLLTGDEIAYVSEINTIPGFTPISLFPRLCAEGGYDFPGICVRIVELARERAASRPDRRLTRADLP